MRYLLFYDNLIRDYRGLLLLQNILKKRGHTVFLRPLWKNAIDAIDLLSPDTVVMGQVGEFSTSVIGLHCHKRGVNLAINSTENVYTYDKLEVFFKVNFKEFNSEIIDMQVVASDDLNAFVQSHPHITHKDKYKYIGFPRLDLSVYAPLTEAEIPYLKDKYSFARFKKIYLFVSSFIYDDTGGQVDKQNYNDLNPFDELEKEKRLKAAYADMLKRLMKDKIGNDNLLLIKKHPWDKSDYFEKNFGAANCIVLDEDEYITPVIALADIVLHTQSTGAIEAWILKKPTVSIMPDFDGDRSRLYNHMQHEVIVRSYDELIAAIENYPAQSDQALAPYRKFLDGRSTIRLADELIKLGHRKHGPHVRYYIEAIVRKMIRRVMAIKRRIIKGKKLDPNSYGFHFKIWEKKKPLIRHLYKYPIQRYIEDMRP